MKIQRLSGIEREKFAMAAFIVCHYAYAEIGCQYNNSEHLLNESHVWDVAFEGSFLISFIAYKETPFGLKAVAIAADESLLSRLAAVQMMKRIGERGHYGEMSDTPAAIARKLNLPMVKVEKVKRILDKEIFPLDDYVYSRRISGINEIKQKIMFGLPLDTFGF